jgi:hypothetical protein
MSKFHEAQKNVKKKPIKSVKEKRLEKKLKKAEKSGAINIKKVFEEHPK